MDVCLDDGAIITAHIANTGSMMGLLSPDSRVLLTRNNNPKRVCAYTVQAIECDGSFVGVNTLAPNKLISKSRLHPLLEEIRGYQSMRSEVRYGTDLRSRVDFLFSESVTNDPPLYLEIKNVTLKLDGDAQFPDAVSTRAQKHLEDLKAVMKQGFRAALWFIVQRQDCSTFRAASSIDAHYAEELKRAERAGLRVRALAARCDDAGITLTHEIPCFF